MASNIWNISNMNDTHNIRANILLLFYFLKYLQAIDPSFVTITKPLSNKIGETLYEGLKWMCTVFEKIGQTDL